MIGLLNYFQADNYGAVLQAYALQKEIEELGFDSELINYKCDAIAKRYSLLHFNSVYQFMSDICYFKDHLLKKIKFKIFRRKYLTISDKFNKNTIDNCNELYSKFITGSDQVFNYTNTNFDKVFFLDFVNKIEKKYSYAASFGISEIPLEFYDDYQKLLKNFNMISFREKTGTEIYSKLVGDKALCVLDPTLIVSNKVWDFEERYDVPSKYILIYMLERSNQMLEFTKWLQNKTGYEVVYIGSLVRNHRKGLKAIFKGDASPQEFVYLFKNADYIITNSFHGTAFSIIFKKNFWVEKLNGNTCTNDRFVSLLKQLGLQSRIVAMAEPEKVDISNINYDDVQIRKDELKKISLDFLKNIVGVYDDNGNR